MWIGLLLVARSAFAAEPGRAVQEQSRPPAGDVSPTDDKAAAPAALVLPLPLTEEELDLPPGGKKLTATPTSVPPVIDGRVDESIWKLADVVSDFLQREPHEGAPASEKTEVRILYDDDALYVSFVLYDSEPDKIIARELRRDSRLEADDTIAIFVDTFHDHRNGFLFRVNPLGTKYDATVKDERDINSQWDETWEAAARITPHGWEAEMEIPWRVLRFRTGSHVWGVDFKREIRRKNEEASWSNYRRGFDFRNISQGGHMLGLRDLKLTGRYRLKPYVTGGYTALNATDVPLSVGDGDFGVEDFKVQITPNLTADLTVNTDFAQVEDDEERVNLTRFPLFFPERREFFLEGSDKFTFGGGGGFGGPLATLFHSRNIGLSDGAPVPMRYGAKIQGKLGATSVGFINAQTGSDADVGHEASNYSVLRLKQDILRRSSVGVIFTNAQGGGESNRVAGLDASFNFYDHLDLGGYVARSSDSGLGASGWIGAFGGGWNGDLFSANFDYNYIDEDFSTELGFLRRTDILRQSYSVGYKPRPAIPWIRQISNSAEITYIADTDGEIDTREQSLRSRWQLQSGDGFSLSYSHNFERLKASFDLSDTARVEAGDYTFDEWSASFDTYRARRLSGRLRISGGGFYGGTRRSAGIGGTYRMNEKVSLSPSYDLNRVEIPGAAFDTHVLTMRGSVSFNERWLTSALVQYNSLAERLSVFARLNYIYRTGDDFFLVVKSTTRWDAEFHGMSDRAVIAKMTRSFEF